MEKQVVSGFMESTRNVFETMLHMQVEFERLGSLPRPTPSGDLSVVVEVSGDVDGYADFRCPLETARRIYAMMSGRNDAPSIDDVSDAIGEVAGMIAGGAASRLQWNDLTVSCPSVTVGSFLAADARNEHRRAFIACDCDCGPFTLEIAVQRSAAPEAAACAAEAEDAQ
ncbi:MAG: chemotaxis protein CheX [Phycisphaerae bacterium]|nr:chemotaxis protein CheX [Phycisphaerae bacterium]